MNGVPLLDVFPASVESPETSFRSVRAVVDENSLLVVFGDTGSGVGIVGSAVVNFTPGDGRTNGPWEITDVEGGVWRVARQGGCGCGNRLKRTTLEELLALVPA